SFGDVRRALKLHGFSGSTSYHAARANPSSIQRKLAQKPGSFGRVVGDLDGAFVGGDALGASDDDVGDDGAANIRAELDRQPDCPTNVHQMYHAPGFIGKRPRNRAEGRGAP